MPRAPFATWKGPVPHRTPGGMRQLRGLVLHIMQGTQEGTDSWFRNPASKVSAHFGVAKDGRLWQWVDTDDRAWAQASGNLNWVSVENEGRAGDALTPQQLTGCALLLRWLHEEEGVPYMLANTPADSGLGYHSMGGHAWGGHACPGPVIVAQRDHILHLADPSPQPSPPPFVVVPYPEDHMRRIDTRVSGLDDQGGGYLDLAGTDADDVVSVVFNGSEARQPAPPKWSRYQQDNVARVRLYDGAPNGAGWDVSVWVAEST